MSRAASVPCLDLLAVVPLESQPHHPHPPIRDPAHTPHLPDPHAGRRNPNRQGSKQFLKVLKGEAPASACIALTTVLLLNHDLLRKNAQVIKRPGVSWQALSAISSLI